MVMRPGTYQPSFDGGELAPELFGGWGLRTYRSGLALAQNIQPVPQGGFTLLPRSQLLADLGPPASAAAKLFPFSYSLTVVYTVSIEPGHARIFKGATQVGLLSMPYTAADIQQVTCVQRFDTMILWHQNYAPQEILRGGSDTSWSSGPVTWANMPQVQYGGTYTNTNEVWEVQLQWVSGTTVNGQTFNLTVDGYDTVQIPIGVDWPTTAASMQTALEAIPELGPGITVTVGSAGSLYQQFTVTFAGPTNSGSQFDVSGNFPLNAQMALTTARTVKGVAGGEDVMSVTQGWSRCGTFFQDRLLQGGFAAKPDAWLASRTGEYFDLNILLTAASGGMLINFDADGSETILFMIQGVYLGFFTSNGMYHLQDRTLSVATAPNLVKSPQAEGCSTRVAPVIQENAVLYVNHYENIVYAATYDALTTTFQSTPLTVMCPHLIQSICDAALQKSFVSTNAQRYYLVRDDGLMVVGVLIRNQDVQPFVRWVTDGLVRAVSVDDSNAVTILVDRQVNGVTHRCLEQLVDGTLLDAAQTFTFTTPTSAIAGLTAHAGATVWAIVDGYVDGPFTVSPTGTVTLTYAGLNVTVGRWTPPVAITLPLIREVGNNTVLKRPARVHTVQLDLMNTTSLAVGANNQPARNVAFAQAGDPVNQPTPAWSGEKIITGLTGFSPDGQITLTQVRPGYLEVRDVTIQAKT